MVTQYFDFHAFCKFLSEACGHYEKSAPTVETYLDDLYRRLSEEPEKVSIIEITTTARLLEDGIWLQANYAANLIYHMQYRLGHDTSCQAGF